MLYPTRGPEHPESAGDGADSGEGIDVEPMPSDSRSFEVEKPVEEVFRTWSHYENLEQFAPQIKEVRQTGERTTHWVAEAMGMRAEWDAETTALEENRRIAWRSISGFPNSGEVLFEPIGESRTRVTVNFEVPILGTVPLPDAEGQLEEAIEEARTTLENR